MDRDTNMNDAKFRLIEMKVSLLDNYGFSETDPWLRQQVKETILQVERMLESIEQEEQAKHESPN